MLEHDDLIETQLRAWAEDLADRVPVCAPQKVRERRAKRWMRAAAVAAAAVLVVTLVAVRAARDGTMPVASVGPAELVRVDYERLEYEQAASLTCPGEAPREEAGSAVFEMWGDRNGRRWRNLVTYPDGSERELVVRGSPWYPTSGGQRGKVGLEVLGCGGDVGTVVAEPGQGSLVALNPPAEIPRTPDGPPAVIRHTDVAEVVPGEHVDSEGRPAVLWRQVIEGRASGGFGERPLTQTEEWFVDAATGDVLERRFEQRLEGISVARWRLTATDIGQREVSSGSFSTDGFDPLELFDSPWEDDAQETPTTLEASPDFAPAYDFMAMARSLDADSVDAVGFSDPLRIAVGGEVMSSVPIWELPQEGAWTVDLGAYAGRVGTTSVLELIRSRPLGHFGVWLDRSVGCPSADEGPDLEHDHVLSIQPTTGGESCLSWSAVDLYVRDGLVVLVDLRLSEP